MPSVHFPLNGNSSAVFYVYLYSYIYDTVVYPLGTAWTKWYNLRALKETVFVFAPDVCFYSVLCIDRSSHS